MYVVYNPFKKNISLTRDMGIFHQSTWVFCDFIFTKPPAIDHPISPFSPWPSSFRTCSSNVDCCSWKPFRHPKTSLLLMRESHEDQSMASDSLSLPRWPLSLPSFIMALGYGLSWLIMHLLNRQKVEHCQDDINCCSHVSVLLLNSPQLRPFGNSIQP